jgi:DNA invertase Pin-like site-specific DNA recombinase
MASTGQKFKKINTSLAERIKNELLEGHSVRELARKYTIPRGTISNWQQKQKYPEKYKKKEKMSKPITLEDYIERYEIIKKYQAFLKAQREKK